MLKSIGMEDLPGIAGPVSSPNAAVTGAVGFQKRGNKAKEMVAA